MNVENLRRTARAIAADPDWYEQSEWYWVRPPSGEFFSPDEVEGPLEEGSCYTPACVAGYAVYAVDGEIRPEGPETPGKPWCRAADGRVLFLRDYAAELLGLTPEEATAMLTYPVFLDGAGETIHHPTAAEAVAMLFEAADTGRVVWRRAARQ